MQTTEESSSSLNHLWDKFAPAIVRSEKADLRWVPNPKIEWTDSTFNPWVGCTKVARARGAPSACDFCYAEKWAKRSGQVEWGNHPRRRTTEAYWRNPSAWNNRAELFQAEHGRRQRVFCASLADVFDNQVGPRLARGFIDRFVHAMNSIGSS